jgi:hypothetical protein
MEMVLRSSRPMDPSSPRPTAMALVRTAAAKAMATVKMPAASTFCPRRVSRRVESVNVPAWMVVDTRLPKLPKMLPRIPMAAGTSTSRPGYFSSVPVIDPRKAPAARLVVELSDSDTSA